MSNQKVKFHMKVQKIANLKWIAPWMGLATLALSLPAQAQSSGPSPMITARGGDGTGNGGSPLLLRMKLIKEFINTELRTDAAAYIQNLDLPQIGSGPAREALKDMIARDIATDIQESSYVIQDSCAPIGGQEAGGALPNDLGGNICLSPKALAGLDSTKAEIVGLIIHEHAHHFGYVDADYAIYKAVYQTVWLANPQWRNTEPTQPVPGPQPLPEPPVLGMHFVKLGPASFWMGSPQSEADHESAEIQHLVHLSHSFEIQATDVTQAQYIQVMGNNPSIFQKSENCPESFASIQGVAACPNHPVENVSFADVQLFISRLNARQKGRYFYRLPTEAEWEYAARGGSQTAYSFGSDPHQLYQYGWFYGNSGGQTHAVASLKANAYGLYDMQGNVLQWVQGWSDVYPTDPVTDPTGPSFGSFRVLRGGSWNYDPQYLRSAQRFTTRPGGVSCDIGFRLLRTQ